MSILVIRNDPCLTMEYSPTIVETTLDFILNKHGNTLGMARYGVDYRIGEEGEPQVFSFFRDALNPIKGLKLGYEKKFNAQTSRKSLNYLMKEFNNRDMFSEIITVLDKDEMTLYLELFRDYKANFTRYFNHDFPAKSLKRIWDKFSPYCPEQKNERTRGFKWTEQTIPFYLNNYMGIIFGKNYKRG